MGVIGVDRKVRGHIPSVGLNCYWMGVQEHHYECYWRRGRYMAYSHCECYGEGGTGASLWMLFRGQGIFPLWIFWRRVPGYIPTVDVFGGRGCRRIFPCFLEEEGLHGHVPTVVRGHRGIFPPCIFRRKALVVGVLTNKWSN